MSETGESEDASSGGPDPAVFDAEQFRANFSSEGLMKELIELFPGESAAHVDKIRAALREQDGEALHRAAHALKGLVGNYAAGIAFEKAREVDALARAAKFDEAESAFVGCLQEVERLGEVLIEFGKSLVPG